MVIEGLLSIIATYGQYFVENWIFMGYNIFYCQIKHLNYNYHI